MPNRIKSNTRVDGYISNVDLFPTIMDYLGIGSQKSDGKSLRGLMEGRDSEHGKYVVTEWDYRGDISPNYMIIKDGWKLIIPYSVESQVINALYNLNEDPYEMNNIYHDTAQRNNIEELKIKLSELQLYYNVP